MDNVTGEKLEQKFKGEGERRFREIADLGGFGNVPSDYAGGLDVRSIVDPANTAVSEAHKSKIAELAGMNKDDRKRIESGATTSSADRMKSQENT